jgi:hypothetical protein
MRCGIAGAALAGAALFVGTGVLMAAPAGRLAPKDIEAAFFTGKPFTASTPSNVKFKMTFKPDGTMTRESIAKANKSGKASKGGVVTEGTWKLSLDGFCSTWKGGKENCYRVHENGPNKWAIVISTQAVAYWSK